ncbi:MAG: hypothetical protein PHI64_06395 [Zoogloea sp.]|uniref:hypothetical protein n=1 Tax=Zoogloea sp. TaxID=49181 RepID=UPI00261151CA|nr:hypothetical protein [Zoogloea sp.]MDD2988577.1 hypothetical protein [Zoogloea sp.]
MELKGRNATWLELAVAPLWRLGQTRIRIHTLKGGRDCCMGITVDDRWLCANDGRLTVFDSRDSAIRFLELLRIEHMEEGCPTDLGAHCGTGEVQCLRLGSRGLRECDGTGGRPRQAQGPQKVAIRPSSRRTSFRTDFLR